MGFLSNLIGSGVGDLLKGAGSFAKDIRSAITGEMSPEKKAEINIKLMDLEATLTQAENEFAKMQSNIIVAEAQGQSWLQRNWRPLLMLIVILIVANNYIIYPYLSMFTSKALQLELPDHLWTLLKIGVGGYIVGRSAEKVTEKLRG